MKRTWLSELACGSMLSTNQKIPHWTLLHGKTNNILLYEASDTLVLFVTAANVTQTSTYLHK